MLAKRNVREKEREIDSARVDSEMEERASPSFGKGKEGEREAARVDSTTFCGFLKSEIKGHTDFFFMFYAFIADLTLPKMCL